MANRYKIRSSEIGGKFLHYIEDTETHAKVAGSQVETESKHPPRELISSRDFYNRHGVDPKIRETKQCKPPFLHR